MRNLNIPECFIQTSSKDLHTFSYFDLFRERDEPSSFKTIHKLQHDITFGNVMELALILFAKIDGKLSAKTNSKVRCELHFSRENFRIFRTARPSKIGPNSLLPRSEVYLLCHGLMCCVNLVQQRFFPELVVNPDETGEFQFHKP